MSIFKLKYLSNDCSATNQPIRPPWAVSAEQFQRNCTRCDACISVCPENMLIKGENGYPETDFDLGQCSFCQKCVTHCHHGALSLQNNHPWDFQLSISACCLNLTGSNCLDCADQCHANAISIKPQASKQILANINLEACYSCAECTTDCPVGALKLILSNTKARHYYKLKLTV